MKRGAAPTESQIQRSVIKWWAYAHKGLGVAREDRLFAVPNGGGRDPVQAAILVGEGVRRGVPDLLLLVPRATHHGLAIEMKRPGGRLRPEQEEFLRELVADGYCCAVCFSFDQARAVIEHYLKMK